MEVGPKESKMSSAYPRQADLLLIECNLVIFWALIWFQDMWFTFQLAKSFLMYTPLWSAPYWKDPPPSSHYQTTPTPHPHLFLNNPLPSLLFSLDFKRCICSPWVERITMTIKNQKRQRPCNDWTSSFEPYWRGRGRRKRRTTHPDAPQLRFIVRMLLIRILRKECYFRWK